MYRQLYTVYCALFVDEERIGLRNSNPLLYELLYKFIVFALVEETAKYLMFKRVMQKNPGPYSWLDMAVLMAAGAE